MRDASAPIMHEAILDLRTLTTALGSCSRTCIDLREGLECISQLKEQHKFRFILHFVVQEGNYHEMEDIILLGKKYNADRVWLNKIEDWNVSPNFEEHNIFRLSHPLHDDYKRRLKQIEPYLGFEKNPIVEIPTLNI